MSKKFTKKLGADNYKRPKVTLQEQLSAEEIAEKLQGYVRVADGEIEDVPLDTHLRYFILDEDGSQQFRLGGFLKNKTNANKYVVLSNGKNSWSVQVNNTVFFRKLNHQEELEQIHELYRKKLKEKDDVIKKLKKYIKLKIAEESSSGSKKRK